MAPNEPWTKEAELGSKMLREGSLAPHPESDQGKALKARRNREDYSQLFWWLLLLIAGLVGWGFLR